MGDRAKADLRPRRMRILEFPPVCPPLFTGGNVCPTACFSIDAMIFSASSRRPCVINHRGLSGTNRRAMIMREADQRPQSERQPPTQPLGK